MTKDLLQTKKIKNFIKLLQKNNIDLSKITVEQAKGDLMDVYQENFQNYKPHKKQALYPPPKGRGFTAKFDKRRN